MRFRFGWRKELKSEKQINEPLDAKLLSGVTEEHLSADNELKDVVTLNEQPEKEGAMTTRILFFGDHDEIGNLYTLFLRSKGYEVFHFPSPATCALVAQQMCCCPREHVCADLLIADMEMEGMTGLELIRHQKEKGCRSLPACKAVISRSFTHRQEYEATALGCKTLRKPFRLLDMLEWVNACEKKIAPDRKLTPYKELVETTQL
jgi:CheY-like chemotaxis protein